MQKKKKNNKKNQIFPFGDVVAQNVNMTAFNVYIFLMMNKMFEKSCERWRKYVASSLLLEIKPESLEIRKVHIDVAGILYTELKNNLQIQLNLTLTG